MGLDIYVDAEVKVFRRSFFVRLHYWRKHYRLNEWVFLQAFGQPLEQPEAFSCPFKPYYIKGLWQQVRQGLFGQCFHLQDYAFLLKARLAALIGLPLRYTADC